MKGVKPKRRRKVSASNLQSTCRYIFLERRHKSKHSKYDIHASATLETQLIPMGRYKYETLKGKVDLNKVNEISRAIRRRYANRKNLDKIFSAWDSDNTGHISTKNVYEMMNSLGLTINYDEARVIVASADRNGNNTLQLEEFLDLLYNNNDALNVNIAKMKSNPSLKFSWVV